MISLTEVTVYTANKGRAGILRTAARSVLDIYRHRHLIWVLFSRDFKAQFKQNLLGYLWAALGPLMGVFSFIFMNFVGILNPGPTIVPYPVYAFIGTSLWSFLTSTIALMSNGLNAQSELIMRTNVPKIALAASALASIFYGVLVNLALIILFLLVFRMPFTLSALAFPILIFPLIVLGVGIGLIVSVLGIIVKDIGRMLNQILVVLMFLTPVIFVSENIKSKLLHRLIMDNPLTYLVELPRSILFGQGTNFWPQYLGASLLCFAILLIGVKVFDIVQDLVAERL
jgi:ABC-type polysaccharide/polyol phosphate export permease